MAYARVDSDLILDVQRIKSCFKFQHFSGKDAAALRSTAAANQVR
jgi:hypothetical protein